MARKETRVQKIARLTARRYPFLGQFARKGGVDIKGLVRFVLAKRNAIERAQRKKNHPGTDARDISFTAGLLEPLSNKALEEIGRLGQNVIYRRLEDKVYPFSRLNMETREKLRHLPTSWLHQGAQWQLNSRKPAILLLR